MDKPFPKIGTAGWTVPTPKPAPRAAGAAETGSHLERYARRLDAVEINSSFYRPHSAKTYARWAAATPADFRFSVKIPKAMTHERKLEDCGALLDRFAAEVSGLGDKLGVLLVQLPPKSALNKRVAGIFFRALRKRIAVPVVLEPRNASWFSPDADAWLAARAIARVAADPVKAPLADLGAREPGGWPGLVYYRWHGAPRIYYSEYDAAALAALHRRLEQSRRSGVPAWCIFDNTASGAAFGNALALMSSLGRMRASL
jgi:uncharacterized protein YecE (DUF72 family)